MFQGEIYQRLNGVPRVTGPCLEIGSLWAWIKMRPQQRGSWGVLIERSKGHTEAENSHVRGKWRWVMWPQAQGPLETGRDREGPSPGASGSMALSLPS